MSWLQSSNPRLASRPAAIQDRKARLDSRSIRTAPEFDALIQQVSQMPRVSMSDADLFRPSTKGTALGRVRLSRLEVLHVAVRIFAVKAVSDVIRIDVRAWRPSRLQER
ncbi:MAG: hypothetical protein MZV49_18285 [Rhodopseudomonas palustris]|nr:hypothetical protein [Rhodopseudomonas palustris]